MNTSKTKFSEQISPNGVGEGIVHAHKPVLVSEICSFFSTLWQNLDENPSKNIFVDLTFGAGGHFSALQGEWVKSSSKRRWIYVGVDRDSDTLHKSVKLYQQDLEQKTLYLLHGNSNAWPELLAPLGLKAQNVRGILMDCGLSSMQIDQSERGFSFQKDGPLDMRMDRNQTLSADIIVNTYSQAELSRIFRQYGELDCGHSLAAAIIDRRQNNPFHSTFELKNFLDSLPLLQYLRRKSPNVSAQPFQAIRIEVNRELEILEQTCQTLPHNLLAPVALAFISFHSLEDRIVKGFLQYEALDCVCNKKLAPICTCGKKARIKLPKQKKQIPGAEEILQNSRSRSAKVRFAYWI